MTSSWRGLYLQAPREQVADALIRLAKSRGYSISQYVQTLDQPTLENVWDSGIAGRLDTLEVIFLLTLDIGWTRLIGLEFAYRADPRLFYSYELVMLMGCDAFECGFVDRIAWWYSYYEGGLIHGRFCSDPLMSLSSFTDQTWGPDDPRVIYAKCLGIENMRRIRSLPSQVAEQFQGNPGTLSKILKPHTDEQFKNILAEDVPENAIERLSQVINLPYIGEYETANFLEEFAGFRLRGEPIPDWIMDPIEQGLTLIMLHHPKYFLLHNAKKNR